MSNRNLRDHWFNSRMAAGNFLIQSGFREETADCWVSRDATAKIEAVDGRIHVIIRKRPAEKVV